MRRTVVFRVLILLGCILWVVSCIGESKGFLPISTIGMLVSIPIYAIGIYLWLGHYKQKNGHYPKVIKTYKEVLAKMKRNLLYGIFFLVRNLLSFYTFLVGFTMILIFAGYLTVGRSESVKTTQQYLENTQEIKDRTGHINYYSIFRNVHTQYNASSGKSTVTLTLVSQNGVFSVHSKLKKENGTWQVIDIKLSKIKS